MSTVFIISWRILICASRFEWRRYFEEWVAFKISRKLFKRPRLGYSYIIDERLIYQDEGF
jgi:hypothetical protein